MRLPIGITEMSSRQCDASADASWLICQEPLVGLSESNKLLTEDRAGHDWYRFVLSYPPHLVRHYITEFELTSKSCVLDPFCGTGTTLVECKKLGIPSLGIEANPMAHFASCVKTNWRIDPEGLVGHARRMAARVRKALAADGLGEDDSMLPAKPMAPGNGHMLRTLSEEAHKLLLKDCIHHVQLHKTLVLAEHLGSAGDQQYCDHESLALAKALVTSISNLHFGPEVGVRIRNEYPPVVSSWLKAVLEMAEDLRKLQTLRSAKTEMFRGDARDLTSFLKPQSVDAVITSPPYPNEKDYTRTTRLESVILGFFRHKQDLRSFKKSLLCSNTRTVYKADDDDQWIEGFPEIIAIADQIEARRVALGKTSGFERLYKRVTKLYFGGMARHLSELRTVLRPGAHLAYVVGDQASYLRIMIRTGSLLAMIAQHLGYEVISQDLFRTRLATATREKLREEVVVLRWPG